MSSRSSHAGSEDGAAEGDGAVTTGADGVSCPGTSAGRSAGTSTCHHPSPTRRPTARTKPVCRRRREAVWRERLERRGARSARSADDDSARRCRAFWPATATKWSTTSGSGRGEWFGEGGSRSAIGRGERSNGREHREHQGRRFMDNRAMALRQAPDQAPSSVPTRDVLPEASIIFRRFFRAYRMRPSAVLIDTPVRSAISRKVRSVFWRSRRTSRCSGAS